MKYLTDDVRITGMEEVSAPAEILKEIPVSDKASERVYATRQAAANIIHGTDPRLLVIVGPCSIHDPVAALEYADRLAEVARQHEHQLHIIMRVYFEKPRTTVGWKGLINDPHLNNSYDINHGLRLARQLLLGVVERGLGTGTEYLDPITPQYLGDLVSWGAIGARTTESQVHRQLASGLSCPIGFKNSTNGSIQVAVDAINSARNPHIFLSVTKQGHSAIFSTAGNPDCHVILRGGGGKTNFDPVSIQKTSVLLEKGKLKPRIMVDMSHANSEKQHSRQLAVCDDLCQQLDTGEERIFGVMIESNLVEGRQDIKEAAKLVYGQSVTDACIGWDDTQEVLGRLAASVERRRSGSRR